MDQAKTTIPHQIRNSKTTDTMENLPVHCVSVFAFGGPKPILGFLNLPDLTKNSSMTVSILHRSITKQIEAHIEKFGDLRNWPKRLHICFDNAVGENLNSNVFMYLGALVHHGIFERITVGTLLVGHTHNINDQSFSVYSKYLDKHEIISLQEMMKAFEENYHGCVKETVKERDKREKSTHQAEQKAHDQNNQADENEYHADSESDASNYETEVQTKKTTKKKRNKQTIMMDIMDAAAISKPEFELLEQNADVKSWITQDRFKAAQDATTGLGKYHVFAFERTKEGETYLFSKFLVNSEATYPETRHKYMIDGDSLYRRKALLFSKGDFIKEDPSALPFNHFDPTDVIKLIDELRTEKTFLTPEKAQAEVEIRDTCKKLVDQVENQSDECKTCSEILSCLKEIGTCHRPIDANRIALLDYKAKIANRTKKQEELQDHLSDETNKEFHTKRVMKGWWTNWINNWVPQIKASREKSQSVDYSFSSSSFQCMGNGLLSHPDDMTREEAQATNRVEVYCQNIHGHPKENNIAIIRAKREEGKPPIWVGKIAQYRDATSADFKQQEKDMKSAEKGTSQRKSTAAAASSSSEVVSHRNRQTVKFKRNKDQFQSASSLESVFQYKHIQVDWMIHIEPNKRKKITEKDQSGSDSDYSDFFDEFPQTISSRPKRKKSKKSTNTDSSRNTDSSGFCPMELDIEDDEPLSSLLPAASAASSSSSSSMVNIAAAAAAEAAININESASVAALSRTESTEFSPLTLAEIDKWKDLKYTDAKDNLSYERWYEVGSLIWWGPQSSIFTADKKIKANIWKSIQQDLRQQKGV